MSAVLPACPLAMFGKILNVLFFFKTWSIVLKKILNLVKGKSRIFSLFSWLSHFALFPNSEGISKMEDLDGNGK